MGSVDPEETYQELSAAPDLPKFLCQGRGSYFAGFCVNKAAGTCFNIKFWDACARGKACGDTW